MTELKFVVFNEFYGSLQISDGKYEAVFFAEVLLAGLPLSRSLVFFSLDCNFCLL